MLIVKLVCPKCFAEQEWSGTDFEDWVECPCGYGDEAWFFWHTLSPISAIQKYSISKTIEDLWVRSANYPNDALCLDRKSFIDYSLGRGDGMVHGGSYTLRVWQPHYDEDNCNYGKCEADLEFNLWNPSEKSDWVNKLTIETKRFCKHLELKAKLDLPKTKVVNKKISRQLKT